jgi:hypothetical protein
MSCDETKADNEKKKNEMMIWIVDGVSLSWLAPARKVEPEHYSLNGRQILQEPPGSQSWSNVR